mgnify:CR=1 FL=1
MNLKSKKILITGATGGIGNCLVKKFNELGSSVIATGTNESKLGNLKKDYPNIHIERWFKDKLIHFHGYNGSGLDGPNCRKVISKISELKSFLLSQHLYNYLVLADLLESFSKVADACFGMKLNSNFSSKLNFNFTII